MQAPNSLYRVVRGLPLYYALLLVPPFMYSLTHQNMRFTLFWVTLAIIYTMRYFVSQTPEQRARNA